jgi:hypothetical protein
MEEGAATVRHIRRTAGEAGHVSYEVDIHTADGGTRHYAFNGNLFVGPVLMFMKDDRGQIHTAVIDQPRQFGEFATEDWVHRFFAEWRDRDEDTEHVADSSAD